MNKRVLIGLGALACVVGAVGYNLNKDDSEEPILGFSFEVLDIDCKNEPLFLRASNGQDICPYLKSAVIQSVDILCHRTDTRRNEWYVPGDGVVNSETCCVNGPKHYKALIHFALGEKRALVQLCKRRK